MFDYILFAIFCYYSYRNKPSIEHLEHFILDQKIFSSSKLHTDASSSSSFFKKLTTTPLKPTPRECRVIDLGICCIGIVEFKECTLSSISRFFRSNNATASNRWQVVYLGLWNKWWEMYRQGLDESSPDSQYQSHSTDSSDTLEEEARAMTEKAIKAKTKGECKNL
jgi:hypothetical protein